MKRMIYCSVCKSVFSKTKYYKYHSCSDDGRNHVLAKKDKAPRQFGELQLYTNHTIEILKRYNGIYWYGLDLNSKQEGWFLINDVYI